MNKGVVSVLVPLSVVALAASVVAATRTGGHPTSPVAARAVVLDPSGIAAPSANLPGWRLVSSDDFAGTTLNRDWIRYQGKPLSDADGYFDKTHLSVSEGQLVESTYADPRDGGVRASAGIKSTTAQVYGKYEVRFKFDEGTGITHTLVLWPATNTSIPEIDFSSDGGASPRSINDGVLRGSTGAAQQVAVPTDLSTWHTFGVEWTPGKLVYTMDGTVWATQTGAHVPSIPMQMAIQTQARTCPATAGTSCPAVTTPAVVNLDVDWVVQYAYSPVASPADSQAP